ncbi:DUF5615 family PIN-like protein [Nocardia otitidiscaviarum]|uniref:DUF5615 family PIN-like protein n=1 Tax=Nocardia otitidiscaviarum TaxID=1823 RepID=UPI0018940EC3|nr:DUF5615 family PIN-like protein [Nocardia otitidiscaviarum]MBF6183116.1 DUF5615 family PIN-like protein [Nocardia otitidiscaviarum]
MKFLIDAQLPPALARALAAEGYDAVHVCDIGMTAASDHQVWEEAIRCGAAIVTKDEDFILIGRARPEPPAPAVVWIRIGNCTRKALLEAVLPLWSTVDSMVESGERIVEIR